MRKIGLLCGMSWESSAEYYRLINESVRERLGGLHSAECLLHLADATADAVRKRSLTTVGLLGTAFIMEQSFHRDRLARGGPAVLVPEACDRAAVHRIICTELCLGIVREESRQIYREVIDRLVSAGAEGAITAAPRSNC